MKRLRNISLWQLVALVWLVGCTLCLMACSDDDPVKTIDYYISVEEEFLVNDNTLDATRYDSPIDALKTAMRKAYPKPNATGDDQAVLEACNQAYSDYCATYTGYGDNITCVVNLVRANMEDYRITSQTTLATYVFNVNPASDDASDDSDQ